MRPFAPLALLVLLVAGGATAQAESEPLSGPVYLDDVLVVAANATLSLGPGVQVTGPGHFEVWGSLVIAGTPASRAEIAVPILLLGNGTSRFEHARLYGSHDAAIVVRNGSLDAHDVTIDSNGVGVSAESGAFVDLRDVTFRANAGSALRVAGAQSVSVARSLFLANGRGVSVTGGRALVQDSTFRGDATQIEVAWTGGALNASFARNDLAAEHLSGGPLVVLRGFAGAPAIEFAGNRMHGAAVGVLVAGPGPTLVSRNDTIDENVVGLSLNRGEATLIGTRLGNARDVEGSATGALVQDNVTYLRPQAAIVPQAAAEPFPWAFLGLGALVLAGVLTAAFVVPARRRAQELPEADPAPPPPPPPTPIPTPTLTPQELRILLDVVANPGSAQAAIAQRLGMTRQALHYHVKKLDARGLLRKEAQGRETHCRVPPEVAAALPTPGANTRSAQKP